MTAPVTDPLAARIARFAPVEIRADVAALPTDEREALTHLVAAARVMDGVFLEQVWAGNPALLAQLGADRTATGQQLLHYFLINKGPWSRLDHDEVFVPASFGVPAKLPQANFYPADATKADIEQWIAGLTGPARDEAVGFFSVIKRRAGGGFQAVPYHVEYRNALVIAAGHLKTACEPHHPAIAQEVPRPPRRRVPLERLLRERHRVDGAGCLDRADHRPVRDL